ncbi:hypothetical protein BDF19DRAFT_428775 [Syncephalis fuscata]|nr:hypothetical protein BDF19DRAFT_428775 [Syncephalis fuscata]
MMINHLKPTTGETDRSNVLATHVFDLANGQLCMGTITTHHGETFLLKATEEAVTIFSRSLHYSDTTTTLKWNVWEFSARHLGYGPRCLMQGEICFKRFEDFKILVRKLDDNRVLIENNSKLAVNIVNKDRADEISLAMISTECGSPNACIKNVEPIWLLNNYRYSTVPLFGFNRILVMYSKNWAIHSLTDGAILAHIDVETLSSVPGAPRLLNINKYTKHFSLCIGGFIVCSSKDDGTLTAIDLINSNRTRKLGKKNSEYLYKQVLRRRTIIVRLDRLINHPLLLNDTFNTRNAMLIARGKDYKIIDLSF